MLLNFTKSRKTIDSAMRGYKDINMRAMKILPRGGYLATCSCSHFASEDLFRKMQESKTHFAVVLDEYGGLGGIISISDSYCKILKIGVITCNIMMKKLYSLKSYPILVINLRLLQKCCRMFSRLTCQISICLLCFVFGIGYWI